MDDAMMWLALVAALAAVASAVFAFVQAKAATDSRRDAQMARDESREARDESSRLAGEANEAFIRQALAQEEANRLKIEEMTPPDWTVEPMGGQLVRITNTSGVVLTVADIDIQPERAAGLVKMRRLARDGRYEYGDVIEFLSVQTLGGGPEYMTIGYTREGSADQKTLKVRL